MENRSLHTVCNLHIGIEGDAAWAEGYSIVWVRKAAGYEPITLAYNHWDFRQHGDLWRMARHACAREIGAGGGAGDDQPHI